MAAGQDPSNSLMVRAGLAVAKLALAIAPHARRIWIACGPGNNGGDGYEAACHLAHWGKEVVVTRLAPDKPAPPDATVSLKKAIAAGVTFADTPPRHYDLCIDALFGIGRLNPWTPLCEQWIKTINASTSPVLSVDLPSGLDADTGRCTAVHVRAQHTLSLLTLKPGLFTADGREACGSIWFNDLDVSPSANPCARLGCVPTPVRRAHNTHKGSFGDVVTWGGDRGMEGAAILAGRAALSGGAGRSYVALLSEQTVGLDIVQPGLMLRTPSDCDPSFGVIVAGCGGGSAIKKWLPLLLQKSQRLVLDADALNAIASTPELADMLVERPRNSTVLTPHPLEAARLMGLGSAEVQSQRLQVARSLASRFGCVVVLKGSGTIVAAPDCLPVINPTGNGLLANAGTGDVLAGMVGARLAQGQATFAAACNAVFQHGAIADAWSSQGSFTAVNLISGVS